jgi:hypothetical protein
MNDKLGRIWNELIVVYFWALSHHLHGRTGEKQNKKLPSK